MKIGNAILMTMFSGRVPIIIGRGDTSSFYIVQGAIEPNLLVVLQNEDGALINLTGAAGTFTMMDAHGNRLLDKKAMDITGVTPANGEIQYEWTAADTAKPGIHQGEVIVTPSGGEAQPIYELIEVHIRPKLSS